MLAELEDLKLQLETLKDSIEFGMDQQELREIFITAYRCRTKLARLETELKRMPAVTGVSS